MNPRVSTVQGTIPPVLAEGRDLNKADIQPSVFVLVRSDLTKDWV